MAAIARVVGENELHEGDMAIVKKAIAIDQYEHMNYVYADEAWIAMNGSYNASNVYFDNNLVLTYAFGQYAPDASGKVTIPSKGVSVKELLENAYSVEEKEGLITAEPTASVNGSTKYYEIGSTGEQTITVTLSEDGAYKYGYSDVEGVEGDAVEAPINDGSTGVVVDTSVDAPYLLTFDGVNIEPTAAKGNQFVLSPVAQTAKKEMSIVGSVYHTEGKAPVSNLGKMYPS